MYCCTPNLVAENCEHLLPHSFCALGTWWNLVGSSGLELLTGYFELWFHCKLNLEMFYFHTYLYASWQDSVLEQYWREGPGPHWLLGFVLRGFSMGQLTAWQLVSPSQEDSKLKREITVVLGLKHWSNIPSPLLYSVY